MSSGVSLRSGKRLETSREKICAQNSGKRSRSNCEKICAKNSSKISETNCEMIGAKNSGKRSKTNCEKISAISSADRHIEFTHDGTPIGEYSSNFSTYYAKLVRDRVSCTIMSWKEVDEKVKEDLWQEVKDFWNIKDDTHKKTIVRLMGERWRCWKTRLLKEYISNADPKNPKNPCDYFTITEEEWEKFKMQKACDEFKKKSAQAKEAASKNIHPHRLGSGGYKRALPKWSEKDIILSGSSSLGISSSVDSRSWRWLRARAKPISEGVYEVPNPATREVLQRVESKVEDVSQGLFQPNRYNDILSAAIGTPEHSGRVRGYAGNVGLKTIYGSGPRKKPHTECITKSNFDRSMEKALQKQKAELTVELTTQFNSQMQSFLEQMNLPALPTDTSPQQSHPDPAKVSSNLLSPRPLRSIKVPTPCNLFISRPDGRIILSNAGDTMHHELFLPDQARPDDCATGDETETTREIRDGLGNEQEENHTNTIDKIDRMVFNDEVRFKGYDTPTNVDTPLQSQAEGSSYGERTRRKVSKDEDIDSMIVSFQAVADVITKAANDIVKSQEEVKSQKVVKPQEVRQVSKSEIWKLLEELDLDEPAMDKAYIFLIKNPDMLDGILGCPSKRRRNILFEMMK